MPSLSRTGGLPDCLSALLGQWGPGKPAGRVRGNPKNDFDDRSANLAGGVSVVNTEVAGRAPSALSDQAAAFLSKLQDQSIHQVVAGSIALEGTGQSSNAIRAFERANSATTAAVALLASPSDASWRSSPPAGAAADLMA